VKNRAVVEAVFALLAADGVGPLAFAFGEFDEVGYGFGASLSKRRQTMVPSEVSMMA